jgi:ABC-type molybdate transport system permease subunit
MSLIADMNRIRPLPTVAREVRALLANVAFAALVLVGLWVFELPLVLPSVVVGVVLLVMVGRLAYRVHRGDDPDA